jgi:hypothetical protein
MRNRIKKKLINMSIIIAILVCGTAYLIYWAFYDIQRFHGQNYLCESTSPNCLYTVTAYSNNGGATVDFAVLGVLKNNDNGKEKNIYWQYHCQNAKLEWVDNKTIMINGRELNVENEIYDYRRELD